VGVDWASKLICKQQIRKVHASRYADAVKPPSPCIYIQKLELPIARILLELHFDEPVEVDSSEESL
jgi:hypothetical protein